jgi:hypothetical protein
MAPKSKWATGIEPKRFRWIVQGSLALCERPGGVGEDHRKVRRQEELKWLRNHGFSHVVSVLRSPHNAHVYSEADLEFVQVGVLPLGTSNEPLQDLYRLLHSLLSAGRKVLVHADEVSDGLLGLAAGFLAWSGLVPEPARAAATVELLVKRPLGAEAREILARSVTLPRPEGRPAAAAPRLRPVEES